MATLVAYVSKNSIEIDARSAQAKLQEDCPKLLQPNESIVFAFKDRGGKGRDDCFFTTNRILHRDKTGLTGKKVKHLSIPFGCVKAYAVETAGGMDSDVEMEVMYAEGRRFKMDFMAGKTDIFAIKRFLNDVILVNHGGAIGEMTPSTGSYDDGSKGSTGGNMFDWMGDNATQIDPEKVEGQLKSEKVNVLQPDESVELAFKCGRDSFICTSKRLLIIDVKGMGGKRVSYLSVLWKCIRAFSVETAGGFMDRDSELVLYTNISNVGGNSWGGEFPSLSRIEMDFKKGKADIYAVQRFFADKLLGSDSVDPSDDAVAAAQVVEEGGKSNFVGDMMSWFGDDNKMVDAAEMDQQYHSNPAVLQPSERVEMAFKGRRDLVLMTSKRLLVVDFQGRRGKKIDYFTLPWKNVQVFAVSSAGGMMDKDSEMCLWTDFNDLWWPPKENEEDPPPPPIPRKTYLEFDFKKDRVDLMAVHRYLSERCLRVEELGGFLPADVPVSADVIAASPPDSVSSFLSAIGNDGVAVDPSSIDDLLHNTNPMLQADENVVLAYRVGRDLMVYTTKRVLHMDKRGMTGKKILWKSIPYRSIRAFSVESAGSWDRDAEVKLYCGTYWVDGPGSVMEQDLRKGKADILAIQSLLAAQVMGGQDGSSALRYNSDGVTSGKDAGAMSSFTSWVTGDGVEMDADKLNEKLHADPPILQPDETADVAFKVGRDMIIFTTKRVLFIDRQGMTGKKVEYKSYPLRYLDAFKVDSAGGFLSEAKTVLYTNVPGASRIEQELKKKGTDIWNIMTILASKTFHSY